MPTFAELIRRTRLERGWTQEELADRTGVTSKTVGRWERGNNQPDADQVRAVTSALGITTEEAFRALGWLSDDPDAQASSKAARWDPAAGEPPEPLLDDNEIYLWNNPLEDWQMRWQLIIAYRVLKASKEARERERQPRRETG